MKYDADADTLEFTQNGQPVPGYVATGGAGTTSLFWYVAIDTYSFAVNYGQQPFAYADNSNLDVGKVTVGGVQYSTLFQSPVATQLGRGALYFDENTGIAMSATQLKNKYGIIPRKDHKRGIRELTEQPNYPVVDYVRDGEKIRPVRDYTGIASHLVDAIKAVASTWAATTSYTTKSVVVHSGRYYRARENHVSTSAFDSRKWNEISLSDGSFSQDAVSSTYRSTRTLSSGGGYSSPSPTPTTAPSPSPTPSPTPSQTTYTVTVSGGKFYINGSLTPTLSLTEGNTYIFSQSASSNAGHPLRFSATANGTHGGGTEYTTGVTKVGTPGSYGAYTSITVASGAPTLYYYCSSHSGMGGTANTPA